jgi:periplasmic protein TonB
MFDDFRPSANAGEARRRMGGSMAVAVAVYVVLGLVIIGGTTAATTNVVEQMTQVDFAPPPPPPPPPPEPIAVAQPVAQTRPKVKRKELKAPDKVPDEKPKESDAPLADAAPSGPVEGFLNGVEGGTGTKAAKVVTPPPPSKPEPTIQPVLLPGNQQPAYSASAKRKEVEGVVVVGFDVLENGSVANVAIVSGPEELRENVLKAVKTWRFKPATRGGKPVRLHLIKSIRFRLTDA